METKNYFLASTLASVAKPLEENLCHWIRRSVCCRRVNSGHLPDKWKLSYNGYLYVKPHVSRYLVCHSIRYWRVFRCQFSTTTIRNSKLPFKINAEQTTWLGVSRGNYHWNRIKYYSYVLQVLLVVFGICRKFNVLRKIISNLIHSCQYFRYIFHKLLWESGSPVTAYPNWNVPLYFLMQLSYACFRSQADVTSEEFMVSYYQLSTFIVSSSCLCGQRRPKCSDLSF